MRPTDSCSSDMSACHSKFWDESWIGLDVGHRGAGMSFHCTESPNVRENTIESLRRAANHGADYVEFDVQLSKDLIPVIYHDYYCYVAIKKKNSQSYLDMLEVPVKDLTLEQLRMSKVYHREEKAAQKEKFDDSHLEDHQPFPSLEQLFNTIDPLVGFNVEIKWNIQFTDGTYDLKDPIDLNVYLDRIIRVVYENAGFRKVVFSCFNADVCTMLRYKQNRYPVLFLFRELNKIPQFVDPRSQCTRLATNFILSTGLLGINVFTGVLLSDPSLLQFLKERGLVVFCWGPHTNNRETIRKLKGDGVDGLIYDRIEELMDKKQNVFQSAASG